MELAADAYLESKGTNSELAKLDHAYLTSEGTNSEELAKLEDHSEPSSLPPALDRSSAGGREEEGSECLNPLVGVGLAMFTGCLPDVYVNVL